MTTRLFCVRWRVFCVLPGFASLRFNARRSLSPAKPGGAWLPRPGFDHAELNGFELQEALARVGNQLPIIFLTADGDIPMSVRAMKSGAVDFLIKPCGDEVLLAAIGQALARDQTERMERQAKEKLRQLIATLTPREHEVMLGVVAGQLNKQIAAELGTVEKTIKVHRARVMRKLGVVSVADLVRLSEQAGVPRKSIP